MRSPIKDCQARSSRSRVRQRTSTIAAAEVLEGRTLLTALGLNDFVLTYDLPYAPDAYGAGRPSQCTVNGGGFALNGDHCTATDSDGNGIPDEEEEEGEEEEGLAIPPDQVAGAFLTGPGDGRSTSFNDILQGRSDTCAFSAVLSGVANTGFDFESGLREIRPYNSSHSGLYEVRVYQRNSSGGFDRIWQPVEFDGTVFGGDLQPTDNGEYWHLLYLRAYLDFSTDVGANYTSIRTCLETLTGHGVESFNPQQNTGVSGARQIEDALEDGRAIIAGTRDAGPSNETILLGNSGLVHNHAYTVMGIDIPSSPTIDNILVSLRNPWGEDTAFTFFDDNGDNTLQINEWQRFRKGLNGVNDGLFEVSWRTFTQHFDHAGISELTGPSVNYFFSQPPEFNNQFPQYFQGDFTDPTYFEVGIIAGEELVLDMSAVDPEGRFVLYNLSPTSPGNINEQGLYRFQSRASQAGDNMVTVIARTNDFDSVALNFLVYVDDGNPNIQSLSVSPGTVDDSGTTEVTLTANNVISSAGRIDEVLFFYDQNNNGQLDYDYDFPGSTPDHYIGSAQVDQNDNATWTGFIGGLVPGTEKIFAQAYRYSASDRHIGNVVSANLNVTEAPEVPPSTVAVTPQRELRGGLGFPVNVGTDANGNFRIHAFDSSSNPDVARYRQFTATAANVGGPVNPSLSGVVTDVGFLPTGGFVQLVRNGSRLDLDFFNASGTFQSGINGIANNAISQTSLGHTEARIAVDGSGNMLIVYAAGAQYDEELWAVSVAANGTVTRSPWRVDSTSDNQTSYSVALNDAGEGIIVWNRESFSVGDRIWARRVTDYGQSNTGAFAVSDASPEYAPGFDITSTSINNSGEVVVTWMGEKYVNNVQRSVVRAIRYDTGGDPVGSEFTVNTFMESGPGYIYSPEVDLNNSGWAVFAWSSPGQDSGDSAFERGIYAQVYAPDNTPSGGEFAVHTTRNGSQYLRSLALNDQNYFMAGWYSDGSDSGVEYRTFRINQSPTIPAGQTFEVEENEQDVVVGNIQAVDTDLGDSLTFEEMGSSPFNITTAGQLRVDSDAMLDHEGTSLYSITVKVTDGGGLDAIQTISVGINDIDEAPIFTQTGPFTIPELSAVGTYVGTIAAFDPEGTAPIRFRTEANNPFRIDPVSGDISVKEQGALDFETTAFFDIPVIAFHSNHPSFETSATLRINLTDIADESGIPIAPFVDSISGEVPYLQGNLGIPVFPNAVFRDPDSPTMNAAAILVSTSSGGFPHDRFSITSAGNMTVQNQTEIYFSGQRIGTVTDWGVGSQPLRIVFNGRFTPQMAADVLKGIRFRTIGESFAGGLRNVSLTFRDGSGQEFRSPNAPIINVTSNAPGSIGDFVWFDTNRDGIQDSGEAGMSDVRVLLFAAGGDGQRGTGDDQFIAETTTDASGNYEFAQVPPGSYYLSFVLPAEFQFTRTMVGSNPVIDSDAESNGLTRVRTLSAGSTISSWDAGVIPAPTSIIGYASGDFFVSSPDASGDYETRLAVSLPGSINQVLYGDFNGDGIRDIAAWMATGDWRVGLGKFDGQYDFSTWTTWRTSNIKEIHVGDFNNDGRDDIIGLFKQGNRNRGRWWVGVSDGTRFLNRSWGDYGNYAGINDVLVGNFDGLKGDDLVVIASSGVVWMVKTSNTRFQYLNSHRWDVNHGFEFAQTGDFNGDGRADIMAIFGTGAERAVFVAKSIGPALGFYSSKWTNLTVTQSLDAVLNGDIDGDGRSNLIALLNGTKVWTGQSNGQRFAMNFWLYWPQVANGIADLQVGDSNGDQRADLFGRTDDGVWHSAQSNGTSFVDQSLVMWGPNANWQHVAVGPFKSFSVPPNAPVAPPIGPTFPSTSSLGNKAQAAAFPLDLWQVATTEFPASTEDSSPSSAPESTRAEDETSSKSYETFGESELLDLLASFEN